MVFRSLLLAVLCQAAMAFITPDLDKHWQLWKHQHDKIYLHKVTFEFWCRQVWEKNFRFIYLHNLEASLGVHSYDLVMNHLGDLVNTCVFASLVHNLKGYQLLSVVQELMGSA
uniref:Cathepsin propeptide inhibitor domain-containing protein n=1 Tax=Scleropages formosus TaxID=113540 RepID=A0A8C9R5D4_SCLFO